MPNFETVGHELLSVVGCTHYVMPVSVPHTLSTTKLYYMPYLFFTSISICYSPKHVNVLCHFMYNF